MPLRVQHKIHNGSQVHVWQITESIEYFREHTSINLSKWTEVSQWKEHRIKEWLAGRFLIQKFGNCTSKDLIIDEFGKPQIPVKGEISISHSGSYAAILTSNRPCGLDIQIEKPAIQKIEHKFCNDDDYKAFESHAKEDALHYIWCAKESIYKAFGKKEVDFKKHISIVMTPNGLFGTLKKPGTHITYGLQMSKLNDLFMTYCNQVGEL